MSRQLNRHEAQTLFTQRRLATFGTPQPNDDTLTRIRIEDAEKIARKLNRPGCGLFAVIVALLAIVGGVL